MTALIRQGTYMYGYLSCLSVDAVIVIYTHMSHSNSRFCSTGGGHDLGMRQRNKGGAGISYIM